MIDAPEAAMERVLEKHANVRALVENGWVRLHALQQDGTIRHRRGPGVWTDVRNTHSAD
jgi:hypothetical protein